MSCLKKINIVGLGPGNIGYITKKGIEIIRESEIAIGGARQLSDIDFILNERCEKYILKKIADVIPYIKKNRERAITIIVSGDTGFYSLLSFLGKHFKKEELNVVPGISSYQYLFSKLGEVWQNYHLISVHGREMDYLKELGSGYDIVLLTDDKNTPYTISKDIYENGYRDLEIIVGEQLSYEDERIIKIDINDYELLNRNFKMNVTVIRKK